MSELPALREALNDLQRTIRDTRDREGVPQPGNELYRRKLKLDEEVYVFADGWGGAWLVHTAVEMGPQYVVEATWLFEDASKALEAAEAYQGKKQWVVEYEGAFPKPCDIPNGSRRDDCPYSP